MADRDQLFNPSTFKLMAREPYIQSIALKALWYEIKNGKKISKINARIGKNKIFDRGLPPKYPEGRLLTALVRYSAKFGFYKWTKMLLKLGADSNAVDHYGYTALMWAIGSPKENAYDTVASLIENGADLEVDCSGWTPLMRAAALGDFQICKLLLEAGANPNRCDPEGVNALMIACIFGQALNVEALIEAGADWKSKDIRGRSVVHWAAAKGRIDCLQQLEHVMDTVEINMLDAQGVRPVEMALESHFVECARWLTGFENRKKRVTVLPSSDVGSVAGFGGLKI